MTSDAAFLLLLLSAAILYSSVGHAGASGYLAVMALFDVRPEVMKPAALVLNLIVATIATVRFVRAGLFSWRLLWPFAVGSIPLAFLGGAITLPGDWYKILVGVVLLIAAYRLARSASQRARPVHRPDHLVAFVWGALLGLLAGLTGTGGGIFLSPLLLFAGWADTRETGGVAAAFILVNSASGLAGNISSMRFLPAALPVWVAVVIVGAIIGTELGTRRVGTLTFRRLLAAVLAIAGTKLVLRL